MQGRILGFGQAYLETSKDKDGDWLTGDNNYRLHVPPKVPVKQFWSITLYDNVTRGPAITDQGASDLSSRKPDLITNADGSVDISVRPSPTGKRTGLRLRPEKAGSPTSASTHQRKPTSTRRGPCRTSRRLSETR